MIVVDPELREECVINGRMTITMNVHKELCGIQKSGMHKEGEMEGAGGRQRRRWEGEAESKSEKEGIRRKMRGKKINSCCNHQAEMRSLLRVS